MCFHSAHPGPCLQQVFVGRSCGPLGGRGVEGVGGPGLLPGEEAWMRDGNPATWVVLLLCLGLVWWRE